MANVHAVHTTGATTVTTTTETVGATIGPFNINDPGGQGILLEGILSITAGTGTTSVTCRLRQGTGITGTVVGNAVSQTVTAGNTYLLSPMALDTTLSATNQQYVITVQQTGATANGTINYAVLSSVDAVAAE